MKRRPRPASAEAKSIRPAGAGTGVPPELPPPEEPPDEVPPEDVLPDEPPDVVVPPVDE